MQFQAIATGRGVSILAPTSIGSSRQVRMSDGAGAESWQTILSSDVSGLSSDIASAVAALVNSAPTTLDTLSELATALGNDPNFATTIASSLAGKQPLNSNLTSIAALSTSSYGRGALEITTPAAFRTYIGAVDGAWAAITGKPTTLSGYGITDAPSQSSALDQLFSETITWTGTTAPSGTATTRYQWVQVGKLVFFQFRFEWTTQGSSLTAAQFLFPSGFPTPATLTGQSNSEVLIFGAGGVGFSSLGGTASGAITEARAQLTSGGALEGRLRFPSNNLAALHFSGCYPCQ